MMDFSGLCSDPSRSRESLGFVLLRAMTEFSKYHPDKGMPLGKILKLPTGDPLAMMKAFVRYFTKHAGEDDLIYIIICECDTLADEILARSRKAVLDPEAISPADDGSPNDFSDLLKSCAGGSRGRPIDRVFMTGVVAGTMGKPDPGLGLCQDISLMEWCNAMAGITLGELSGVIDETVDFAKIPGLSKGEVLDIMQRALTATCSRRNAMSSCSTPASALPSSMISSCKRACRSGVMMDP